jgi:hypothetical protein
MQLGGWARASAAAAQRCTVACGGIDDAFVALACKPIFGSR